MPSSRYIVALGAFGLPPGAAAGAPTPEQLSRLDRALTPDEQRQVDAWQAAQADAQLAAERRKGGPTSATVSVSEKGAVIQKEAQPLGPLFVERTPPGGGYVFPTWGKIALGVLGVLGVLAIGAGVATVVSR